LLALLGLEHFIHVASSQSKFAFKAPHRRRREPVSVRRAWTCEHRQNDSIFPVRAAAHQRFVGALAAAGSSVKDARDRGRLVTPGRGRRSPAAATRHADLPHDALRQLVHSTARALQLHIWRFAGLSTEGLFCIRARGSHSGRLRAGFGPSSSAGRASLFPAAPKASDLDFLPHGQFEISISCQTCASVFPAFRPFGETRFAYYAIC
jgi:hypothetical protein